MKAPKPPANDPVTLDGVTVPPGKSARVEIPVSTLSTGTQLSIPVVVVNGRHRGPRLVLSAAIHGDELNGVDIVRQVIQAARPAQLHGTLIAVPVVNVFGFVGQSRYLPDRRDLNRSFPGSRKGSLASQMAHLFLTKIVNGADFAIDLHTGSNNRTNWPQVRANLKDEPTREAARAFGAPVIVQARLRADSYRATAAARGLPVLLYEAGEALRFDREAVAIGVQGVQRVMHHLGMIPNLAMPPARRQFVADGSRWIRVGRGGILHLGVEPGDRVRAGDPLGAVMDIYGAVRSRLRAPFDGLVIGLATNPLVSRGDAVVHLAYRGDAPDVPDA